MQLSNDHMALTLAPDFGARVTRLTDRRSGRQWLVDGSCEGDSGEDSVYLGAEARGWDECFPTVAPCDDPDGGRRLRDHGDLWGRAWDCAATAEGVAARFVTPGFAFERDLTLSGPSLTATYRVTNTGADDLPYLWSQHCLLATTAEDRLHLTGFGPFTPSGGDVAYDWPTLDGRDLTEVMAPDAAFALKCYAPALERPVAAVSHDHGGIRFEWNAAEIKHFGLWLDYGGWPAGAPVHQIALEPTTAAADHLAAAATIGQARRLAPRETHTWAVRITLTGPAKGDPLV